MKNIGFDFINMSVKIMFVLEQLLFVNFKNVFHLATFSFFQFVS